jgi:hypothetical protein
MNGMELHHFVLFFRYRERVRLAGGLTLCLGAVFRHKAESADRVTGRGCRYALCRYRTGALFARHFMGGTACEEG